jgi:small-conductance mechanosensitive channel
MNQGMWEKIYEILGFRLVSFGGADISILLIIKFSILLGLLFWGSRKAKTLLVQKVLPRAGFDHGTGQAIGTVTRYAMLLLGFPILLQTVGINLTTLNVLAGTLGIGLGFGLQNIASNFISGLILLFESPIKVGDRVVVGEVDGDVVEIGARSTTVITNNNIAIIVPNTQFVTQNIVNWKYRDNQVRFEVPIGVAYGSDLRLVCRILLEIAAANPDVLESPSPDVVFLRFGDSSIELFLRVWTITQVHWKPVLVSAINFEIYERFQANGIEIPFPQRVVRLQAPQDSLPSIL